MFDKLKDYFLSLIKTRIIFLYLIFFVLMSILIVRIFDLQIIKGDEYLNSFQLQIKKEISLDAARGKIYDRNGKLLAYDQLAYSVKIEDVFESGSKKNEQLNKIIYKTIKIIESNNDKISMDFYIDLDDYNNFRFTVSGTKLKRFRADIYGKPYIDDLTYTELTSTAEDMMEYLAGEKRYNVQIEGATKSDILKIVSIRYALSLNSYQKYIATTIATNVSEKTVAVIMENQDILEGVSIADDTIRVYPTGVYTSHIIGYTGKISSDELAEYQAEDSTYSSNDIVGKNGIEKSMESVLKGKKGSETVYVDTMGKVISSADYVSAVAGNDLYLTIDADLQEAVYHILEQKLAGILLSKIINSKVYVPGPHASNADIKIPIYDVYYSFFNNQVIDINHLSAEDATDNEKEIYAAFLNKKESVLESLKYEVTEKNTDYKKLTTEYQNYENHMEKILLDTGILNSDKINYQDPTYNTWAVEETISFGEYVKYAISQNWIDSEKLDLDYAYSDSQEIYEAIVEEIFKALNEDTTFDRIIYRYAIKEDKIRPVTICNTLIDQEVLNLTEDELHTWYSGKLSPYSFIIERIENLQINPAQLALEPCSASCVMTDVNTGDVLALVSYPSYDNNYLANGADVSYFKKISQDLSSPMINYATMQRTAPGSTFKMVTATAGLLENVVNLNTLITCTGSFSEISETHNCWIYPGRHGSLNVTNAIRKSCNYYFYMVGYKLSLDERNNYNSNLGIDKLYKYADMYGLSEKSGVEIEEYAPLVSDSYSVPSSIGQGTHSYTTVGLARYVTAVANSGTVYDLTLLNKLVDSNGNLIKEYNAEVRNHIEFDDRYWNAIHQGMRGVCLDKSYYVSFPIEVAGKTGTAQQSKTKPDHGLFVAYAPYNNPDIAVAVRIANGYSSDNAARTTHDILTWYYDLESNADVVTGKASTNISETRSGD